MASVAVASVSAEMQQLSIAQWKELPWPVTRQMASFLNFRDLSALQETERACRDLIKTHLLEVTFSKEEITELISRLLKTPDNPRLKTLASKVTSLTFMLMKEKELAEVVPHFTRLQKLNLGVSEFDVRGSCLLKIPSSIQFVSFYGIIGLKFKTVLQFSDLHPQCMLRLPNRVTKTMLDAWLKEPLDATAKDEIQRVAKRVESLGVFADSEYRKQLWSVSEDPTKTITCNWKPYTDEDVRKILALFSNLSTLLIDENTTNMTGSAFSDLPSSLRKLVLWGPNDQTTQVARHLGDIEVVVHNKR